jgi:hypothetical protein
MMLTRPFVHGRKMTLETISNPSVRVFVNDRPAPVMDLEQLTPPRRGWIGVCVGNNSGGPFANLTVTASK